MKKLNFKLCICFIDSDHTKTCFRTIFSFQNPKNLKFFLFIFIPSYDTGHINASAEGVNINTAVHLIRDVEGRLKINNITCEAKIKKMKAEFSGTLR